MPYEYRTTEEDFIQFKTYCNVWLDRFGLSEFYAEFTHEKRFPDSMASVYRKADNGICTFNLEPAFMLNTGSVPDFSRIAFHEVLHVLFAGMHQAASRRDCASWVFESEEHRVIRTLENFVFKNNMFTGDYSGADEMPIS